MPSVAHTQSLAFLYGNFVDLTNAWFSHNTAPGPKPESLHWEAAILPMFSGLTSVDLGGKTDHGRWRKRRGAAAKSFQPSAERVGRRGPAGTDGPETTRVRHSHVRRPELRRAPRLLCAARFAVSRVRPFSGRLISSESSVDTIVGRGRAYVRRRNVLRKCRLCRDVHDRRGAPRHSRCGFFLNSVGG